jgi:hypothetical protein
LIGGPREKAAASDRSLCPLAERWGSSSGGFIFKLNHRSEGADENLIGATPTALGTGEDEVNMLPNTVAAHHALERLESRRLFAVTLDNGVLNVVGTLRDDVILVYPEPGDLAKLDVKFLHGRNGNLRVTQFDRAAVTSVFVRTCRGNDWVVILGRTDPLPVKI